MGSLPTRYAASFPATHDRRGTIICRLTIANNLPVLIEDIKTGKGKHRGIDFEQLWLNREDTTSRSNFLFSPSYLPGGQKPPILPLRITEEAKRKQHTNLTTE
jgi:hypothetical protein